MPAAAGGVSADSAVQQERLPEVHLTDQPIRAEGLPRHLWERPLRGRVRLVRTAPPVGAADWLGPQQRERGTTGRTVQPAHLLLL